MTKYLLDTNVFITAKNLHYGFDFCPGFWDWMRDANKKGNVFSIDRVREEINAAEDDLKEWIEKCEQSFFVPSDGNIFSAMNQIIEWVQSKKYDSTAIEILLRSADLYLMAQAMVENYTVVTHEVPSSSLKKVKIPNVCIGLRIKFVTPYEMLRKERARFVLKRK